MFFVAMISWVSRLYSSLFQGPNFFVSLILNCDVGKSFGGKEMRAYVQFKNKVPFKAEPRGGNPTFWCAAPLGEVP